MDVQGFIRTLNDIEGTNKYRLPSEAEWEYAARACTTTRYFFGCDKSDWEDHEWKGKTHSVCEKKPNPWGLYDIYGNVWEYVEDKWHENYQDAPVDGSAWEGNNLFRLVRGGSWSSFAEYCRSAVRIDVAPTMRSDGVGFRLVKEI